MRAASCPVPLWHPHWCPWDAGPKPTPFTRARARTQAHEQDHAHACPAVEEIPVSVRNVPLPDHGAAGQPECVSGHLNQPLAIPGLSLPAANLPLLTLSLPRASPSLPLSIPNPPLSISSLPLSIFKADSVYFKPSLNHPSLSLVPPRLPSAPPPNFPKPTLATPSILPFTLSPPLLTISSPSPPATLSLCASHSELAASCHLGCASLWPLYSPPPALPVTPPTLLLSLLDPAATLLPLINPTVVTTDYHEIVLVMLMLILMKWLCKKCSWWPSNGPLLSLPSICNAHRDSLVNLPTDRCAWAWTHRHGRSFTHLFRHTPPLHYVLWKSVSVPHLLLEIPNFPHICLLFWLPFLLELTVNPQWSLNL